MADQFICFVYKQNGSLKKNYEHLKIEELKNIARTYTILVYKEISHKVINSCFNRSKSVNRHTQMQFPIGFIYDIIYNLFQTSCLLIFDF